MLIESPSLAEPLVAELVKEVAGRRRASRAMRIVAPGVAGTRSCRRRARSSWRTCPPFSLEEMDAIDARIAVHAAGNTRELSGIDPSKLRMRQEAHGPVMERYMQRSASGDLTWCVTAYPCEAFAQDAGMSLSQYEDFVFRSGWLHLADPVSAWKEFSVKLHRSTEKLEGVRELRVVAEDTDITVGVAGRTWIPADGDRNFPDGEVFTGPEESVTRGDVRFSYPAIFGGREVDDVRLRFEGGRVVKSEAALRRGPAARDAVRWTTVRRSWASSRSAPTTTSTRFTKQILFDEKIGGTFHMAVGAGYPETRQLERLRRCTGTWSATCAPAARSMPTAR